MTWKFSAVPILAAFCLAGCATSAAAKDGDQDGLPDKWEKTYHFSTKVASAKADSDRDRLSNLREYRLRTNPRKRDTDGDGLSDGMEYIKHKTNPRRKDTDGDGYSDRAELRAGSNPRSKRSIPATKGAVSVLPPAVPAPGEAAAGGAASGGTAPGGGSTGPSGPNGGVGAPVTPPPLVCDKTANPSSFSSTLSSAAPGQTICLATGNYGTFTGARKAGQVVIGEQPGATATMRLDFNGAQNLVVDGVTLSGASLRGATSNITIRNTTFTGTAVIDGVANANIVFDHDSFVNINSGGQNESPARIHLPYTSSTPSGVTVQNSLLAGGDSDGVQAGTGLNIINNEFRDIIESGPNHTDAIQLIGAAGSVVRGNWIHHTSTGIVAYDGISRATIEDNVVDLTASGGQRPWGIELFSDSGSVIRHNTVRYGAGCSFNLACGMIALDRKAEDPAGTGTVVTDNVATDIVVQNGSAVASRSHNLVRKTAKTGDILGTPAFAGGSSPTSYAGFALASSSPGKGKASDGTDIGVTP